MPIALTCGAVAPDYHTKRTHVGMCCILCGCYATRRICLSPKAIISLNQQCLAVQMAVRCCKSHCRCSYMR